MKPRRNPKIRTTAIDIPKGVPTEFRIWRAGENQTTNGYSVVFDETAAASVIKAFEAHGVRMMIDLEHLSLDPDGRHFDPDARGYCDLEVRRDAQGGPELWAVRVQWTADGSRRLTEQTQRYMSPAFMLDDKSRPTSVLNIAIVAMPATHQTDALAASRHTETRMKIDAKTLARVGAFTRASKKANVAPAQIVEGIKALAADPAATTDGEAAGIDIAGLADFLQITINPAQDPAGFVRALMDKLEEVSLALSGGTPKPEPADDASPASPAPSGDMAATSALLRLCGARDVTEAIIVVADWRKLAVDHEAASQKIASEQRALDMTKRRALTARLVVCGAELPSTAWSDEAKTKPAPHLASMSFEDLEARATNFEARNGTAPKGPLRASADSSDGKTIMVSGRAIQVSAAELAICAETKCDEATFALLKSRYSKTA